MCGASSRLLDARLLLPDTEGLRRANYIARTHHRIGAWRHAQCRHRRRRNSMGLGADMTEKTDADSFDVALPDWDDRLQKYRRGPGSNGVAFYVSSVRHRGSGHASGARRPSSSRWRAAISFLASASLRFLSRRLNCGDAIWSLAALMAVGCLGDTYSKERLDQTLRGREYEWYPCGYVNTILSRLLPPKDESCREQDCVRS